MPKKKSIGRKDSVHKTTEKSSAEKEDSRAGSKVGPVKIDSTGADGIAEPAPAPNGTRDGSVQIDSKLDDGVNAKEGTKDGEGEPSLVEGHDGCMAGISAQSDSKQDEPVNGKDDTKDGEGKQAVKQHAEKDDSLEGGKKDHVNDDWTSADGDAAPTPAPNRTTDISALMDSKKGDNAKEDNKNGEGTPTNVEAQGAAPDKTTVGQEKIVNVDFVTTDGDEYVFKNLLRKSKMADNMFDKLIQHMNNAIQINGKEFTNQINIPKWL